MMVDVPDVVLAFLAGSLTTLSPCVLPVLPMVLATAMRESRRGPLYFAAGLFVTFVTVTWLLSSFGTVLGIEQATIRALSGLALIAAGILFVSDRAQSAFSNGLAPIVNWANRGAVSIGGREGSGTSVLRQFLLGALTGVIWTPCSGPSLGAAIGLAAAGESSAQALGLLMVFGLGAIIPILIIAYGSASLATRFAGFSRRSGSRVKKVLGVMIFVVGVGVLTGFDKRLEGVLVRWSPEWLTDLTTRF